MTSKCKSCGQFILWLKTSKGKSMPVDLFDIHGTQLDEKTEVFNPKEMISHFAGCPDAKKWRKKNGEPSAR